LLESKEFWLKISFKKNIKILAMVCLSTYLLIYTTQFLILKCSCKHFGKFSGKMLVTLKTFKRNIFRLWLKDLSCGYGYILNGNKCDGKFSLL
jgi:hypothetical protein